MTVWVYEDTTGIEQRGDFVKFSDHGGTDVSYYFHRHDDKGSPIVFDNGGKRIDVVSGARLKAAKSVHELRR